MKYLLKVLISAVIAFVTLTLFCFFYYNTPVHYTNHDGSTDYIWDKNYYYSRLTEGFGYGKTNNEGLMNEYDYDESTKVDVLVMGSSHIENQYIPMKNNVVSLLNDWDFKHTYYNLGVAGHNFRTCIDNLDAALSKYNPQFVVIETDSILFDEYTINAVINNDVDEITSSTNKLVIALQHNPFLRLSLSQIDSFIDNNTKIQYQMAELNQEINEDKYNELFDYINNIIDKHNTKLIILYHPTILSYSKDTLTYQTPEESVTKFSKLCKENNIDFIDMGKRFQEEYLDNNIMPKGFFNSKVGFGHLNINGHKMLAQEILNIINKEAK